MVAAADVHPAQRMISVQQVDAGVTQAQSTVTLYTASYACLARRPSVLWAQAGIVAACTQHWYLLRVRAGDSVGTLDVIGADPYDKQSQVLMHGVVASRTGGYGAEAEASAPLDIPLAEGDSLVLAYKASATSAAGRYVWVLCTTVVVQ